MIVPLSRALESSGSWQPRADCSWARPSAAAMVAARWVARSLTTHSTCAFEAPFSELQIISNRVLPWSQVAIGVSRGDST